MRKAIVVLGAAFVFVIGIRFGFDRIGRDANTPHGEMVNYEIVASDLYVPWDIAVLPDGRLLVTERNGNLVIQGETITRVVVPGVFEAGEGGLTGIAVHPNFSENSSLYLLATTKKGNSIINRVTRYRFREEALEEPIVIVDDIPGARNHNGGRLRFGPDGFLYITTGDASDSSLAQDRTSLAGKILRVRDDGTIPENNPFGTAVYSYGHRNPQGIAWDSAGRLWETEHGRSGALSGYDEINLIQPGGNYGWPLIEGDETREGMIGPVLHSGPDTTWAPSGMAFISNSLYFGGLRGQGLYELPLHSNGDIGSLRKHFDHELGRLRAVTAVGDSLLVGTSNQDGRGTPDPDDDRVLHIQPVR